MKFKGYQGLLVAVTVKLMRGDSDLLEIALLYRTLHQQHIHSGSLFVAYYLAAAVSNGRMLLQNSLTSCGAALPQTCSIGCIAAASSYFASIGDAADAAAAAAAAAAAGKHRS